MISRGSLVCMLVVGAVAAVQTNRLRLAEIDAVTQRVDWERESARAVRAAFDEGNRRTAEVQKAANEADQARRIAEKHAVDARGAADRLRQQLTELAARLRSATPDPIAASAGPGIPGADALDLLTGMLSRHSAELVEVGEFADRLRLAGTTCERSYDALSN